MSVPSTSSDSPASSVRWRALGVVFMTGFCLWFYSFDLPNGGVSRPFLWSILVDLLLENVDPTPDPDAPPPPSGVRFLPQRLDIVATASFILVGAWSLGHLLLRLLKLREMFDLPTRMTFAFALGLSGVSLLTLGFGLSGLLCRWLFGAGLMLSMALELTCRLRAAPSTSTPGPRWWQRRWEILPLLCMTAITPFLLAMLLGAMLPSIDFDVKEYHLEGPKEYFTQGHVGFLAHNVYTSFPFLTEMLTLLGMVLRDDWYRGALVGKVVLMSFAPLTAIGLFAAGRRLLSPRVGWLCVLVYLTTPWIYRISVIAYAEGSLTFYLFATLLAVLSCSSLSSPSSVDRRPFVTLIGLLAGSAVACKYPGVLSVAIPIGGYLLWATFKETLRSSDLTLRVRLRQTAYTAGLFTLGTLITFGPWMAKNIVETGNPVYPLLYAVFGGEDWGPADHAKWQNAHPPAIVSLIKQPTALVQNLSERIVDVIAKSDWQSPLLFAAAPLAFFWKRQRKTVIALGIYIGWLFFTWWAMTHQLDRFWLPMLPVVALLAGAGLGWLFGEQVVEQGPSSTSPVESKVESQNDRTGNESPSAKLVGGATTLLIVAVVLFNLGFVTSPLCGYNAYLIDLDVAKRDSTTPSIALLNDLLPEKAHVLFVGEAQVFDAEFDYTYNTVFDESIFQRWTSAATGGTSDAEQRLRPTEDILATLHEQGVTHVFVNWAEVLRYRVPGSYGYTDFVSPARFQELVAANVLTPVALPPQKSLRLWESLDPTTQAEVEHWGPSLKRPVPGPDGRPVDALLVYELFQVR